MTFTISQTQKCIAQKLMERLAQEAMQKVALEAQEAEREKKILVFDRGSN